ncbi:hypothetical protein EMIT0P218_70262 [Pseudomonas sp. IT-P218]
MQAGYFVAEPNIPFGSIILGVVHWKNFWP